MRKREGLPKQFKITNAIVFTTQNRFMVLLLSAGVELALFVPAAPASSAAPRVSIFAPFPGNRSRLQTCTTNRMM